MSDSSSLAARLRGLSWLFIETPARAAGFLSVIAIVTILALRFEFGHSWNLYAAGGQVVKAGEDYHLLLQAAGSAYQKIGGELVMFVGGSTVRELTADDALLSKELTSRCGRDIQFVNLGSSAQTFSESWDIAALAPANRKRLLLVGINPYRLSFDDGDVISEQSHNPTGIPASFSLWWSIARHTGHVGSLERMFTSVARQIRLGAKWSPLDLLVSHPAVARQPAEDPFQPDRSSYPGPAWTRPEKLKQANEYIATRALDFHDKFRAGVKWFNRLSDHFEESGGDVRFVITPTDETFQTADRLISNDMRDAVNLLQAKNGILDLHNQGVDLEADDFHDVQHLTAQGRAKLQPVFVTEVSHALGCMPDVSR
jgi:hypothetical protein